MFRKHSRIIAAVALSFFTWTSGGLFSFAHAAQDVVKKEKAKEQHKKKAEAPEERFAKLTEELEDTLADSKADIGSKKKRLKSGKTEIEALDTDIRKQFAETEKKLKDAKLPAEILARHHKFVKHYDDNLGELKGNIERVEKARDNAEAEKEIEKARKHLAKVKAPSRHQKFDPNNLPHRQPKAIKREPRMKKEEFERDVKKDKHAWKNNKRTMVASIGSLDGFLLSSSFNANNPPTAADLAETIEVQLTPEIRAKALELGNNPVKIFEWVRNNIEFVPTWGSIQGAHMTMLTKQGNAFDTSSLLIALLRAAGIHAHYVTGSIELPIDKVMNWAGGFTDPMASLDFMSSGGVPTKALTDGGKVVKARMEHVWVEAFINYIPSRGAKHVQGKGDTWISLDPSYKQYGYTQGIDIKAAVPFDAQSFLDQIKSGATINEAQGYVTGVDMNFAQQTMQNYQARVQSYIQQNYPNATVGDVLGKKEILKKEYPYLLGTLPYKTVVRGSTFSTIPDGMRHKVTFEVQVPESNDPSLAYTVNLSEISSKKIILSYVPATSIDEQIITQSGGLFQTRPYLVNMVPQIKIEGVTKIVGSSVGLGKLQTFRLKFSSNNSTDIVVNNVTVGATYAISLNTAKVTSELMKQKLSQIESNKSICKNNMYTDECLGELLNLTALTYFFELYAFEDAIMQSYSIASIRHLSEAILSKEVDVYYFWGVPTKISEASMILDVDKILRSYVSKTGDVSQEKNFTSVIGQISSELEHSIFEQLYNAQGASTLKLLKVANDQGIPIYNINNDNINTIIPKLAVSKEVKADIENAVSAGKTVTISERNVTHYGWTGVGYIITDPQTGAGAYLISASSSNGGACIASGGCTILTITTLEEILAVVAAIVAVATTVFILAVIVPVVLEGIVAALLVGAKVLLTILLVMAVVAALVYAIYLIVTTYAFLDDKHKYRKRRYFVHNRVYINYVHAWNG